MNTGRLRLYYGISVAVFLVLVIVACGKKGPPVPPGIRPLPAVRGLSHVVDGDRVRLVWKKPSEWGASKLKGYVVHRSRTAVDGDNCDGCPIMFQRVAELNAGSEGYGELIEKGYDYIYKVVAISVYGSSSPDSPLIKFRFDEKTLPEKNAGVKDQ